MMGGDPTVKTVLLIRIMLLATFRLDNTFCVLSFLFFSNNYVIYKIGLLDFFLTLPARRSILDIDLGADLEEIRIIFIRYIFFL